jgi:hypothetical protein
MKKLWIVLVLCSLAFTPVSAHPVDTKERGDTAPTRYVNPVPGPNVYSTPVPSKSLHAYLECHRYRWELHPHLLVIKCHPVKLERGDTAPTPYVNPAPVPQLILLPWR